MLFCVLHVRTYVPLKKIFSPSLLLRDLKYYQEEQAAAEASALLQHQQPHRLLVFVLQCDSQRLQVTERLEETVEV